MVGKCVGVVLCVLLQLKSCKLWYLYLLESVVFLSFSFCVNDSRRNVIVGCHLNAKRKSMELYLLCSDHSKCCSVKFHCISAC